MRARDIQCSFRGGRDSLHSVFALVCSRGKMQEESEALSQYSGFVKAVVDQINEGLTAQLAPGVDDRSAEDPNERARKRLKHDDGATGARNALLARFALGGDDVLYLNNGLALLAAGHAQGKETPIDVSGYAGVDLYNGVRKAVYAEIKRRGSKRYERREVVFNKLRKLVAWLCIERYVSIALQGMLLGHESTRLTAFVGALAAWRPEGAAIEEARKIERPNPEQRAVLVDLETKATAYYSNVLRALGRCDVEEQCLVFKIMLTMTDADFPGAGSFAAGIEENAKSVVRFILDARKLEFKQDVYDNDDVFDEDVRTFMLGTSSNMGAGPVDGENTTAYNDAVRYVRERVIRVEHPLVNDELATYCEMRGLVGEAGPTEKRSGDVFLYSFPWEACEGLGATPASTNQVPLSMLDETMLLTRQIAVLKSVQMYPVNVTDTPPARVRWRPKPKYAEQHARAAVLEHAMARIISDGDDVNYGGVVTEKGRYLVLAACKIRQLDSIRKLAMGMRTLGNGADACETWEPDKYMYTTPGAEVRGMLEVPYDAGVVQSDNKRENDDLDYQQISGILIEQGPYDEPDRLEPVIGAPIEERLEEPHEPPDFENKPVEQPVPWSPPQHIANVRVDISVDTLSAHLRDGIELCAMADDHDVMSTASGTVPLSSSVHAPDRRGGSPEGPEDAARVRQTLWKEMLRELAISNDKLWIFVRTLSGAIGEDAQSVLNVADEAAHRAERALQDERKAIAEKVAAFHSKVVETVVGGILRTSKLEALPQKLDEDDETSREELFVMDSEFAKDVRALASGESGRPFFEANVAIQQVMKRKNGERLSLASLIASFSPIIKEMHHSLNAELLGTTSASVGMDTLAVPRNSYFVSLRDDVVAAVRVALDRLHHELGQRRPRLWELVEGASSSLSLRFAEMVGHVLVATRASSGTSSLYVSSSHVATNALQCRVALGRLVSESRGYLGSFNSPDFDGRDGRDVYFKEAGGKHVPVSAGTWSSQIKVLGAKVPRLAMSSDRSHWRAYP